MKFEATAHHEDAQYDLTTLDFDILMDFLNDHEEVYCEVVDGATGEILCYFNAPDAERPAYMERCFELMTLGWMYEGWLEGQEKAEAEEDLTGVIQEVCRVFGIDPKKVK